MSSQPFLSGEPSISFNTFNITSSRRKVQETFIGKIRAFSVITRYEWTYLGISVLGLSAALGLTIERLVNLKTIANDFAFALYFLLTIVFCFYYVIHAVLTERPDELSMYVVCNIIALIYCIVNYIVSTRNIIKLARLIVVCVMSLVLVPSGIYLSYKYVRSNHLVFHTVGGKTELHKACRIYYYCSSLLKFDLQLQLTMLILVRGTAGREINQTEEIILGLGVVINVIFLILGFVGLCLENKIVMVIFFLLGLWEPGYAAYKFAYTQIHYLDPATYWSTIVCGILAMAVWAALMICTIYFTTKCFHIGLKEKMFGQEQTHVTQEASKVPAVEAVEAVESKFNPSSQNTEKPVDAVSDPLLHHSVPETSYEDPEV